MRLWTIQPRVVWDRLQAEGSLRVETAYYPYEDGYVPPQYLWLACQLQTRIPGYQGGLPWWAYCKKPDLRKFRHRERVGHSHVRIELAVERTLAFPSWAWDRVHSWQFLAYTRQENEAWEVPMRQAVTDEDLWPLPEPWRSELEASWLRLFHPDLPEYGWSEDSPQTYADKEAVFEVLNKQDVRAVTHFVGSNPRYPPD